MARLVGQKKAREMWFLSRFYSAEEAFQMGLINAVYKRENLEGEALRWCRRMIMNSPTAIACCKAALNADEDGSAGIVSSQNVAVYYSCLCTFYTHIYELLLGVIRRYLQGRPLDCFTYLKNQKKVKKHS